MWAIYRRDIVDISVIYRNNKARCSMIRVAIIYEHIILWHDLYPVQTTGKIKVKLFLIESNIAFIPEGAQNLPQTKFGILKLLLGPVVQRLDNAIHRINHYPAASVVCFANTYPLDSDLSGDSRQSRHSKQPMAVCGLPLHQGSTESCKTLEQKVFFFNIGTINPHGINERFSFN